MPTFKFTSPEGQTLRVTAPEGATEGEAFEMLQRSGALTEVLESPVGRFMEGLAAPIGEISAGIGAELPEAKAQTLEDARREGGLAKTLGRVTGEVGMAAVPAASAYRGAQALTRAVPWVRHVAPLASESAAVGGMEALKAPEEGETRLGSATKEALLNMGVGVGMGALSRAGVPRLFPKSQAALREEAAQRAMGVEPRLPLAVAAEPTGPTGKVMQWFHRQPLRALPGVGASLRAQTDRTLDDWRESMLLRALPERARGQVAMPRQRGDVEAPIEQTFKGIDDWYKMEYREILDPFNFRFQSGPNAKRLAEAYEGIPETGARREVTEKLGDYLQNLTNKWGSVSGSGVSSLKTRIRAAMKASDDADVKAGWQDVLEGVDDIVEGSLKTLNPEYATRYSSLRGPYRNLVTLEEAAARKGSPYAEFTPDELYSASIMKGKREQGARSVVQGRSPLKKEAQRMRKLMSPLPKKQQESNIFQLGALASVAGATGAGAVFAPAVTAAGWTGIAGSLPYGMQRYLMSEYPYQEGLRRAMASPISQEAARAARLAISTGD